MRPSLRSGPASRLTVALVAASSCVLALSCGGGDDEHAADQESAGDHVRIEHRYGVTTIATPPSRIVSLDHQWTDVLTALDAPLAAAAADPYADTGRFPWQTDLPDGLDDLQVSDALPHERIAALAPDLIVVSWAVTTESEYERLTSIAPTIPLLGDEEVDSWQDMATAAGRFLGDPAAATALVAQVDAEVEQLAAQLPGLDGCTYALANYVPGDAIYVVADPDDGAARLFAQLGMSIDPDLLELAEGASGRVKLGLEEVDRLDADVLILLTNGAEPTSIPGYELLPAVEQGSVAVLEVADITGLNTPTPLSVPYSLERVRPALEKAAA